MQKMQARLISVAEAFTKEYLTDLLVLLVTKDEEIKEYYLGNSEEREPKKKTSIGAPLACFDSYAGNIKRLAGRDKKGNPIYERCLDGCFLTADGKETRSTKSGGEISFVSSIMTEAQMHERLNLIEAALFKSLNMNQMRWVVLRFQYWRESILDVSERFNVQYPVIYKPVSRAYVLAKKSLEDGLLRTPF